MKKTLFYILRQATDFVCGMGFAANVPNLLQDYHADGGRAFSAFSVALIISFIGWLSLKGWKTE